MLLPLVGDGKAVYFLLHPTDQREDMRRLLDAQFITVHSDKSPGTVPLVLHHAQNGDADAGRPFRRQRRVRMAQAAVDQQQVGQGRKLPVLRVGEPPLQHLLHGGIVIRSGQCFDGELAVVPLQGLSVHKDHHGGYHIVAAQIGDIVALHPVGDGGQLRQCLKVGQRSGHPLRFRGDALHLFPGVLRGHLHQLGSLAPLRSLDGHLVARLPGQQCGEGIAAVKKTGQQDLPGQHGLIQIVLAQHGGKHLRRRLLGGGGKDLGLAAQQVAVFNVQHCRAASHGAGIYAPYIGVGAHAGNDLLLLAQHLQRLHPVPQGGGFFKFQRFRRRFHLLPQSRRHLPQLTVQQLHRLRHALAVLRAVRPIRTAKAVAFADVIVQTGPLLANVPGELPVAGGQLQRGAQRLQGGSGLVPAAERAEVAGAVLLGFVHQREPGIGRLVVQPHEGIALVVLQKNIVPGLMPFDQGVFQDQRLKFRADHDGVEVIHLRDHHPGLLVVPAAGLEVLADAVFQLLGLAYIDDQPGLVHHDIHAGGQGQTVRLLQQFLFCHGHCPPFRVFPSIP